MDSSDPNIAFDDAGVCDYCLNFDNNISPSWQPAGSQQALLDLAKQVKKESAGAEYDCIIGLSGGLDSSYTAYVAKELMGLNPLLFHVDAGWNTEQAVKNIECLVDGLGLDLYTDVIDWYEMRDLQVAFLKSQIPDQDLPQDAAFFSALYRYARKNKIKYILTGSNYSTECCREPEEWGGYLGIDRLLFNSILSKFGNKKLVKFPLIDILVYKIIYKNFIKIKVAFPLNLVNFRKSEAESLLNKKFGWQKFDHKHYESRFTRFYEGYWLPNKFGFDKRRAHFSSLISTGQMSRNEALQRLSTSALSTHDIDREFRYVANKLGLEKNELFKLFQGKNKTFRDYKNKRWIITLGASILRRIGIEKRLFR